MESQISPGPSCQSSCACVATCQIRYHTVLNKPIDQTGMKRTTILFTYKLYMRKMSFKSSCLNSNLKFLMAGAQSHSNTNLFAALNNRQT